MKAILTVPGHFFLRKGNALGKKLKFTYSLEEGNAMISNVKYGPML